MRPWAIAALTVLFALSAGTFLFAKGPGNKKDPGGPGQRAKSTSVSVVVSMPGKKAAAPRSTPPGWSQGKKTGWRGGAEPPGQAKKSGTRSVVVPASATGRTAASRPARSA